MENAYSNKIVQLVCFSENYFDATVLREPVTHYIYKAVLRLEMF